MVMADSNSGILQCDMVTMWLCFKGQYVHVLTQIVRRHEIELMFLKTTPQMLPCQCYRNAKNDPLLECNSASGPSFDAVEWST